MKFTESHIHIHQWITTTDSCCLVGCAWLICKWKVHWFCWRCRLVDFNYLL